MDKHSLWVCAEVICAINRSILVSLKKYFKYQIWIRIKFEISFCFRNFITVTPSDDSVRQSDSKAMLLWLASHSSTTNLRPLFLLFDVIWVLLEHFFSTRKNLEPKVPAKNSSAKIRFTLVSWCSKFANLVLGLGSLYFINWSASCYNFWK